MSNKQCKAVLWGAVACVALAPAAFAQASAPHTKHFTVFSGAEVGPGNQPYFGEGHGNRGFFGQGGAINAQPNPTLRVTQGDTVKITLVDLDQRGQPAKLSIPALGLATPLLTRHGETATLSFTAQKIGVLEYNGEVPVAGHHHEHMIAAIVVEPKETPKAPKSP